MKRVFLLVISVVCWVADIAAGINESRYFELAGAADSAIVENRFDDAERLLLEAMRSEPSNPSNVLLMSNLAMVRFYQGNDSLALATINDAHAMAPVSVTVLTNRARIHSAMGNVDDAYSDYELILQLDSTVIEPRLNHGVIALYSGMVDVAERDFMTLKRLAPDSDETAMGLAMYYSALNQPKEAIPYYTRLLAKDPAIEYYAGRINCYLLTEQLTEASADISEAMKLYPDDAELYMLRGWLNRLRFRNEDAEADFKRAIELGADRERVERLRGVS